MTRMFIVAMISAIVSAPFALSVQYLIVTVLSKEAIDEKEVKKQKEKLREARMQRGVSVRQDAFPNSADLVESGSTDGDLKKLQGELRAHYKYLKAKKGKEEAKEFQGESSPSHPCV
jgi:Flp pilus assembly protein TadB